MLTIRQSPRPWTYIPPDRVAEIIASRERQAMEPRRRREVERQEEERRRERKREANRRLKQRKKNQG